MPATLLAPLTQRVDATDVEELIVAVESAYDMIAVDDPDGGDYSVVDYLTDDAQRFAAARAVDGGALPHNSATAKALAGALENLERFHEAELRPVGRPLRGIS